jgi:hypothetical protein
LVAGIVPLVAAGFLGYLGIGYVTDIGDAVAQNSSDLPTYRWAHVAIGGGGFITGYSSDDDDVTQVIRTDVYGAYIWEGDAGNAVAGEWAQLLTTASMPGEDHAPRAVADGVYEIAVAPSDPRRIYMVVGGFFYRSDDRGRTFRKIAARQPFPIVVDANSTYRLYSPFMAVSPDNPNLVLLGTPEAGLLRSDDGGEGWARVNSVPPAGDLDAKKDGIQAPGHLVWFKRSPGRRADVWVMSPGNGIYVSHDDGRSFAPLANGEGGPAMLKQGDFAADGTFYGVDHEDRKAWRYDGAWHDLTNRAGLGRQNFAGVAVNSRSGDIFVFTETPGKAFLSTDRGESWWRLPIGTAIARNDPPWLQIGQKSIVIGSAYFDRKVKDRLWLTNGVGVCFVDIDDAKPDFTCTSRNRGIEELVTNDAYQAPGRAPLFAAWDFGIHRKPDLDAFSTTYGPKERLIIAAQQVVGTPADPDFAATNASDTRKCCAKDDDPPVLAGYSFDAGRTWKRFPTLPQPPGTDAGDPWRMAYGMMAVAADDPKNIVWVPSGNRAPFVTRDLGASWQQIDFPGQTLPDTGSHRFYFLPRKVLAADGVKPGTFYLVHSGNAANRQLEGVWRSEDHGVTWRKVFSGEVAPASRYAAKLRAVPGKAGQLFFTSGVFAGDTTLRRSMDGGQTWSRVDGVTAVDDVGFGRAAAGSDYPTIFISGMVDGKYGIWRSTDGARSWRRIGTFPVGSLDQVGNVTGDPNYFGRVYIGYKGSGWLYGQPQRCEPKDYAIGDRLECVKVE